jgi:hypothetical protein
MNCTINRYVVCGMWYVGRTAPPLPLTPETCHLTPETCHLKPVT